jgi:hypothetical protein
MTKPPIFTSLFDIWDVPSLYAASSGLFLPGVLMTARIQAIPAQTSPSPQASPKRPRP